MLTQRLRYVDDILKSTSREVDQVTVEPNGVWRKISEEDDPSQSRGGQASDSDDGDLVEIKDMPRMVAVKAEGFPAGGSPMMMRTPPMSSREPSASAGKPSTNHKRPAPEVIDLSSDEDAPPRAPKRQATNSQPNGIPPYSPEPSRPTYPGSSSSSIPRSMQPAPMATSNPMTQGYRHPQWQ